MKRVLALLVTIALCALAVTPQQTQGQGRSQEAKTKFRRVGHPILNQYVVVLKNDLAATDVAAVADDLARLHGGTTGHIYQHALKGFSITLPEAAAVALSHDPRVDFVEEDGEMKLDVAQLAPVWNLDRIDQRDLPLDNVYYYNNTGFGVNVYVIDTGIRQTHNEFRSSAFIGADFVGDGRNGNDCNGHGTHVSGTIAGDTYGVAKAARIYAVRVFGCSNSGSTSTVIAGVDWVTNNHVSPAVANMSLGGPASDALDAAVRSSINSGVAYVVAAGNDGVDAATQSPARVVEALTVGATDMTDTRASFSNYGSVVDIFAPGVNVGSAWIGSDTDINSLSGTSMASPHVAGAVALYLQSHPTDSPYVAEGELKKNASYNKVINPGPGTTNGILFTYFDMTTFPPYGTVPFYRYWSGPSTDHFYTTDFNELGGGINGYEYQWIQGHLYDTQQPDTVPLYRYWNGTLKDHFYTTDWNELGFGKYGYSYERVAGYVYTTQQSGTIPLYRYNSSSDHFYTTDYNELGAGKYGYNYEKVACYIYP